MKAAPLALIWDTETTGLISNHTMKLDRQAEIIEFYGNVVNLKNGKVAHEYHTLIQPIKYPMDDYTIKTTKTKITNEMLKDAPQFNKVADSIKDLIESSPMIISHNLSFDMEITDIEFERLKATVNWPKHRVCTVEATLYMKGFRLNLMNLHKHLFNGEEFENAHRAKTDVDALTRCCVELYKRGVI